MPIAASGPTLEARTVTAIERGATALEKIASALEKIAAAPGMRPGELADPKYWEGIGRPPKDVAREAGIAPRMDAILQEEKDV